MDGINWLITEMLMQQTVRERLDAARRHHPLVEPREEQGSLRRSLASRLVRLGLRLDPALGEGPGHLDLSLAEMRRHA